MSEPSAGEASADRNGSASAGGTPARSSRIPGPPLLRSVVAWLRAGYPDGVPESDYIPLLAVLSRRLSTGDVRQVTDELVRLGGLPIDNADIGVVITRLTDELPRAEDVARVRARLAAGGWPLA